MTNDEQTIAPANAPSPGAAAARRAWARAMAVERPSPRVALFLITVFVLPVSLIPSLRGGFFRIPPLPRAWWTVYLVLLFGVVALLFRIIAHSQRLNRSTLRGFAVPFFLLGIWQVVTLLWNGQTLNMQLYSLLQSMSMCAAIVGAVMIVSGLSFSSRVRLASGLTLLVAFVASVYMGLSFLFPHLRPSSAWTERTAAGLGFIRVFGPLGTATTLNFVLLPALGFSFGMTYMRTWSWPLWLLMTLFFIGCVIATGSRGGLVCLATFVVLLMLWVRIRAALLLVPLVLALVSVLAVVGLPERFRSLQDHARTTSYATALRTYTSSSWNVMLGAGHGALYTKLHDDSLRKMLGKDRWYLLDHETDFGYSLRNSHSAVVRTLVETGIPGLVLMLTPLAWLLARPLSRSFRAASHPHRILLRSALAGCAAALPLAVFEELFISAFWVVALWTIYAVCAAEGVDRSPGV